jgi:hypothetical protein
MGNNRAGVEMGYNVQASVDEKEHLVAAIEITQNPTDHGMLTPMINKTQEELRKKDLVVLADKGYYGYADLEGSEKTGAFTIVARQLKPGEKDGKYSVNNFTYDKENDDYVCPEGQRLMPHSKSTTKDRKFFNKDACKNCHNRSKCLMGKNKFRTILRNRTHDIMDRADARYKQNTDTYKYRQQIVEHVFGTVKRTMDGGYFLLRTKEKVKAEASLLLLGYNMKRTKAVLGTAKMMDMIDEWATLTTAGKLLLTRIVRRCMSIIRYFTMNRHNQTAMATC